MNGIPVDALVNAHIITRVRLLMAELWTKIEPAHSIRCQWRSGRGRSPHTHTLFYVSDGNRRRWSFVNSFTVIAGIQQSMRNPMRISHLARRVLCIHVHMCILFYCCHTWHLKHFDWTDIDWILHGILIEALHGMRAAGANAMCNAYIGTCIYKFHFV